MTTQNPPWTPGTLLELSGSYWKTCTLHAAVELDIFTRIGNRSVEAGSLAAETGHSERGLTLLLNALTAMDLLTHTGDRYALTPPAGAFLTREAPGYIGHMIRHHRHLVPSWADLDKAVATGGPVRSRASVGDEAWRESFLMGMFNMAMGLAPQVADKVSLAGRKRLLDLGGGPGTYAIHFCKKNPGLTATVFDLPTTRPFAEKTIARFGLSDRIAFASGDFLEDPLPGPFDAVWMSHVLHGEGPEDCARLIHKAASALAPGGLILIHDFILADTMDGPLFPALFALNMLLGTESGRSYSGEEISRMLTGAGVTGIHRIPLTTPNDSGIMAGIRGE